ncbi:MAG: AAA family ATPase [Elusimicrobiota bacterium]
MVDNILKDLNGPTEWAFEDIKRYFQALQTVRYTEASVGPVEINNFLAKEIQEEGSFWGDGLITPKGTTFITGSAKIGKSTFALNLALSLAMGKDFLGFRIPGPKKVLFLQQEISEFHLQKRLKRMSKGLKIPENRLYCMTCNFKLDMHADIMELKKYIAQIKPDVVVFDPMYKFFLTLDENSSKEIKLLLNEFDKLTREFGIALVIIHHHKKSNGTEKYSPGMIRGSSTLFDYGSSYVILNKSGQFSNHLRVDFELRNAENPGNVFINMTDALWFKVCSG